MPREEIATAHRFLRDLYGASREPAVPPSGALMIAALEAVAPGDGFDHLFMEMMSRHHFTAVLRSDEWQVSSELVSNREATIVGATAVHSDFDDRGAAWKAFAGLRLTPWLGVEAGYADLGRARLGTELMGGVPPLPASITMHRDVKAFGVDGVVLLPWRPHGIDVFAKAGTYRAELKSEAVLEGNIAFGDGAERSRTFTLRETVPHYGVGVQWHASPSVAVRAELERYANIGKPFAVGGSGTTGEVDVDVLWLSVFAKF